ncbi:MAG TPA: hypothetical protein VMH80_06900 [Bryobacteraceae bacterium]|nr:hypothetical protein [Bryobacteraceae bacterium]
MAAIPAAAQQSAPINPGSDDVVRVATVASGIRKGSTSFSLVHQQDKAYLIYARDHQSLFFSVARGSLAPTASNMPIAEKIGLLRPLLKKLLEVEGRSSRYSLGFGNYWELGSRVAAEAIRSGQWDARNGRPASGSADELVKKFLNQGNLYPELADVVNELGYGITVSDVEHVIVEPLQQCDASLEGKPPGKVTGTDKVPCSMSIRFLMLRKEK